MWVWKIIHAHFWLIAGTPLELIILNYSSNTYSGESNYLSIVKSNKIGKSAAESPEMEKSSTTIL